MSEAKHTPGPWYIGEIRAKGQEVWIDTASADDRLSYSHWSGLAVAYGCDEQPGAGAEVAMANALLIAAAPDLLRACEAMSAHYSGSLDHQPAYVAIARAAIAIATGEQQ